MFNSNNYMIDRVRRVTQINLESGMVDWTATSIESPQVEFTGESVDKTDAQGVLLNRFDTAKGVTFSGEASVLSMPLVAAQLGTEVQVASDTNKVKGEDFAILKVVDKKVTLPFTPTTAPAYIYPITDDNNVDNTNVITVGAGEGNATISGKEITLPDTFTGTKAGVLYEYETTAAVKVSDSSEKHAKPAKYIVDVLTTDICSPSIKRAGKVVFPKAKLDNNFTMDLTTEGTHPFSFTALKDYCADDEELCYLLFHDSDTQD